MSELVQLVARAGARTMDASLASEWLDYRAPVAPALPLFVHRKWLRPYSCPMTPSGGATPALARPWGSLSNEMLRSGLEVCAASSGRTRQARAKFGLLIHLTRGRPLAVVSDASVVIDREVVRMTCGAQLAVLAIGEVAGVYFLPPMPARQRLEYVAVLSAAIASKSGQWAFAASAMALSMSPTSETGAMPSMESRH